MAVADQPLASLSLDLDNLWSYQRTRGLPGWEAYGSFLDLVVPRALELVARRSMRMTVFVVGQDAARPENRDAIGAIAEAGHEIGNHSFRHEPWLHRYRPAEIHDELARAEDAIGHATGERPLGFRGPGYSLSADTIRVLVERGYVYDCSTLPTVVGPLARAFYFRQARLTPEEREERAHLFGDWRDGLRPIRPYEWVLPDGERLLEIPVTTFPLLRVPIHVSYLVYAARHSRRAALGYLRSALWAARARGVEPSILLHPLDLLGAEDVDGLGFFPGMDVSYASKRALLADVLALLDGSFGVVTLREHADAAKAGTLRGVDAERASPHERRAR